MLNPRQRFDIVKDPVHGYIRFTREKLGEGVGHGPLTHLLDRKYLKPRFGITHEDLAGKIIQDELRELVKGIRRSPNGPFEEPIDIHVVSNLIKKGAEDRLHGIWRPLHQIIRGAFDADKMDFLLRDGLLCGEQKITIWDVERLALTSFLSEDGTGLQLHYSSLPLLLSFIKFRQHMLEVVYYHRTVRAFELMIENTVPVLLEELIPDDPRERLADYLNLDEHEFFTRVRKRSQEDREIGDAWEKAWQRNLDWKQVEEGKKQLHRFEEVRPQLTAEELSNRIKEQTKLEPGRDYLVDVPSVETPGNVFSYGSQANDRDRLAIYYGQDRIETKTIDQLARAGLLPIKVLQYRLYAGRKVSPDQVKKLRKSFRGELGLEPSIDSNAESSF